MQGEAYAAYVGQLLEREYTRREVLNSRAATAVTSTIALATLTFAAITLAQGQTHAVHGTALYLAVAAVLSILGAAVLAIAAGHNLTYLSPSITDLNTMLSGEHWADTDMTALSIIAKTNVRAIDSLRKTTAIKMRLFIGSQVAQAAAVGLLACCLAAVA